MMATQQFQLLVTLYRTADGAVKEDILQFSSPPNTVEDLKNAVEAQYDIPRCLQTIEIGDRCIRSDDDRLSDHYVFTGDSIRVTYLYEAHVKHARQFTEHLRRLEQHLVSRKASKKTQTNDTTTAAVGLEASSPPSENSDDTFTNEISSALDALEFFAYSVLSGWFTCRTKANRKCLTQVGATDAVVSLLRYLQVNYPRSERSQMELNILEETCLTYLWNLAESIESQEPVVSRGGFELMVTALKCVDVTHLEEDMELLSNAAGCISNYCETPSCQLALAPDTKALQQLLRYGLLGPDTDTFGKLIIGNCFFRMSRSLETHRYLSSPAILRQMLEFADKFLKMASSTDDFILAVYSVLMAIGRILLLCSLTGVVVDSENIAQTLSLIDQFLKLADQTGMRQMQDMYNYNWNSLVPFIEPILCPERAQCKFNRDIVKKLFFFSLTLELPRLCIQRVARDEELLGYLTCLQWYAPDESDKLSIRDCLPQISTTRQVEVPRLSTLVRAKLAVVSPLGFRDVQQPAQDIVQQLINL